MTNLPHNRRATDRRRPDWIIIIAWTLSIIAGTLITGGLAMAFWIIAEGV